MAKKTPGFLGEFPAPKITPPLFGGEKFDVLSVSRRNTRVGNENRSERIDRFGVAGFGSVQVPVCVIVRPATGLHRIASLGREWFWVGSHRSRRLVWWRSVTIATACELLIVGDRDDFSDFLCVSAVFKRKLRCLAFECAVFAGRLGFGRRMSTDGQFEAGPGSLCHLWPPTKRTRSVLLAYRNLRVHLSEIPPNASVGFDTAAASPSRSGDRELRRCRGAYDSGRESRFSSVNDGDTVRPVWRSRAARLPCPLVEWFVVEIERASFGDSAT